jgi:hypothetical protein
MKLDNKNHEISNDLNRMWNSPLSKTPVCKDITRLFTHVYFILNSISRTLSKEKNLIFHDIKIFEDHDDVNNLEFKFLHFINTLSLLFDDSVEMEEIQKILTLFYVENENTSMNEILEKSSLNLEKKSILVPKNAFLETCNIKQEKSLESFFLRVYGEDHPILKILKVTKMNF